MALWGSLIAAVCVFDTAAWARVHLHDDLGMVQTVSWVEQHIPAGTRLASLADGSQFLLPHHMLQFDPESNHAVTPSALRASRTQVVITSSTQVSQGSYSTATRQLVRWLDTHATVLYTRRAARQPAG